MNLDEWIDQLNNDPDASRRAEAAQALGQMAASLHPDERQVLSEQLNQALRDVDPGVLTAAMMALGTIQAQAMDEYEDDDEPEQEDAVLEAIVCYECHRPEMVVHLAECVYCGRWVCEEHWIEDSGLKFCTEEHRESYAAENG
jgi:hypothetical protein